MGRRRRPKNNKVKVLSSKKMHEMTLRSKLNSTRTPLLQCQIPTTADIQCAQTGLTTQSSCERGSDSDKAQVLDNSLSSLDHAYEASSNFNCRLACPVSKLVENVIKMENHSEGWVPQIVCVTSIDGGQETFVPGSGENTAESNQAVAMEAEIPTGRSERSSVICWAPAPVSITATAEIEIGIGIREQEFPDPGREQQLLRKPNCTFLLPIIQKATTVEHSQSLEIEYELDDCSEHLDMVGVKEAPIGVDRVGSVEESRELQYSNPINDNQNGSPPTETEHNPSDPINNNDSSINHDLSAYNAQELSTEDITSPFNDTPSASSQQKFVFKRPRRSMYLADESGNYKCPFCDKIFSNYCSVSRHVNSTIHEKREIKPKRPKFQCHICKQILSRGDTLKAHISRH